MAGGRLGAGRESCWLGGGGQNNTAGRVGWGHGAGGTEAAAEEGVRVQVLVVLQRGLRPLDEPQVRRQLRVLHRQPRRLRAADLDVDLAVVQHGELPAARTSDHDNDATDVNTAPAAWMDGQATLSRQTTWQRSCPLWPPIFPVQQSRQQQAKRKSNARMKQPLHIRNLQECNLKRKIIQFKTNTHTTAQ